MAELASRNPFQGGVGFSTRELCLGSVFWATCRRNPFQGGVGFSTV